MNEAVKPAPYAQTRIREPAGDRTLGETFSVGGVGSDIVVPGTGVDALIQVERRKGVWVAHPVPRTSEFGSARFDGRPLNSPRDLRRNDVIAVGDAQLIVTDVTRTLLRLDVCHLVGNATIAPAATLATLALGAGGDESSKSRRAAFPSYDSRVRRSQAPEGDASRGWPQGLCSRL